MTGLRYLAHLLSFLASIFFVQAIDLTPMFVMENVGTMYFTVVPKSPNGFWFVQYETNDGTARAHIDYKRTSGTVGSISRGSVDIIDDSVYRGDRVFELTLTTGFNLDDPLPQSFNITIIDDEVPPIQLKTPENVTVKENVGELNITLVRLPPTTRTFEIGYYLSGTAVSTEDFNPVTMGPINFAENETEAVLTMMIVDDMVEEEMEWISIYINSTEMEDALIVYINIEDNDVPPIQLKTPENVTVKENVGELNVTLVRLPPTTRTFEIGYYLSGTAVSTEDFNPVTMGPINFAENETEAVLTMMIVDDMVEEEMEWISIYINSTEMEDALIVYINIEDNDVPPIQLKTPENVTVKENVGELNVTLVRLPPTTRTFEIGYYLSGTAVSTEDFNPVTMGPINFAENETEAVLTMMIVDDMVEEEMEWISIYINSTEMEDALIVYINIEDNDAPKSFHCLRASQYCKNGTCETDNFNCECNAGFQGADCSIDVDDVGIDCESCVNGTCLKNGKCICDPGFAGKACDRSAYYHECTSTSFAMCFTPFGVKDFGGQMFVEGQEDELDCKLTPAPDTSDPDDGIPDWCMGYAAVIDFNGTCGEFGPKRGISPATYMMNIKIRYTENITKLSDEKVYLTCKRGEAILEFGPRTVDGEDQHFKQVAESEFAPATLKLEQPNGDPLSDPLTSPAVVRACVSVDEVPAYDFVTIDYILADNGRGGDDFRSAVLYNEGCFSTLGVIFAGPEYDPDDADHTMCFSFEAFIFSHDSQLPEPQLVLTVKFTVGNDPDTPEAHKCSVALRRKRQAESNEGKTLKARLNIVNPEYETSERLQNAGDSTCVRWLYPAFIGVGVVAISMMVIIIILTVAVCKRFNGTKAPKDVYQ